jgi:hypothetical protein
MNDKEQLEILVREVQAMKSSIKRNQGLIREMLKGRGLGFLSLLTGVAFVGFALISHFLSAASGGFSGIPLPLRLGLFAYIALTCVLGIIMKFAVIGRRSREIGAGIGTWQFVRLFYSSSMFHTTISSLAIMIGGSVLASLAGHPWLAVPIVAGVTVMPINAVADVTGLPEYSVTGYASLAGAAVSYFFADTAPFIALAIASGALFFSFAAGIGISSLRERRR